MNSFFLSVSFPRIRWQANCVFRSVATQKHNETLRLWPGSAGLRGERGKGAYTGKNINTIKKHNSPLPSFLSGGKHA